MGFDVLDDDGTCANDRAFPDLDIGQYHRVRVDGAARTQPCATTDEGMGPDGAAIPHHHVMADNGEALNKKVVSCRNI